MSPDDPVTVSAAEFHRSATGELSERQVDAIRNARVPDQYADLDKEIKD